MPDFATKPTLVGTAVLLRPFTAADAPRMLEILSLPAVNLYTGALDRWPKPTDRFTSDPAEAARITAWYESRSAQPDRLDLAIVAAGRLVGEVVLNLYDPTTNSCNLRVLIADDATGHGLGYQALHLVCAYALTTLGLAALTLNVFDFNPRAQHVYEKLGFTATGRIEQDLVLDGKPRASITMRLTPAVFAQATARQAAPQKGSES
ncbi:GNAT family N-acetyltransferase [Lacticaseibacillus kribbianus]|uniref:GNAT family N-acetyltransferase n=1 Tax=Lacticaseibacillus kribbianus TaxID=2926292 RepID=UPI001CD450C5|nr:GNAT family protein [Lacticaseibacillus kribbianus]